MHTTSLPASNPGQKPESETAPHGNPADSVRQDGALALNQPGLSILDLAHLVAGGVTIAYVLDINADRYNRRFTLRKNYDGRIWRSTAAQLAAVIWDEPPGNDTVNSIFRSSRWKNDTFFQSIADDLVCARVMLHAGLPAFAIFHLYRILERASLASPVFYSKKIKDFEGLYTLYSNLGSDTNSGLGLLKKFIEHLRKESGLSFALTHTMCFRGHDDAVTSACFSEFKSKIADHIRKPKEYPGDWIDFDDPDKTVTVDSPAAFDVIITFRNRFAHAYGNQPSIDLRRSANFNGIAAPMIDMSFSVVEELICHILRWQIEST